MTKIMSPEELEQELRAIGAERITTSIRFISFCMAASSTRARCRPGR